MTQDELDAILKRNEAREATGPEDCCGDDPSWDEYYEAIEDCRRLLAEIDKLRAEAEAGRRGHPEDR